MSQKIHEFFVPCFMSRLLSLAQIQEKDLGSQDSFNIGEFISMGVDFLNEEDWQQKLAWFPDFITFSLHSESGLIWLEVWLDEKNYYRYSEDNEVVACLPWYISNQNRICVYDEVDGQIHWLDRFSEGWYQITYEERFIVKSDLELLGIELSEDKLEENQKLGIAPRFCKMTFAPKLEPPNALFLKLPPGSDCRTKSIIQHEESAMSQFLDHQ